MKTGVAVFGRPKGKEVRGTGSFSDQALTKFLYGSSLMPSEENLRQGEHVVVLLQMDGGYKGLSMIVSLRHANSHPDEDQRAGGFVGAAICFEGLPTAKCGEQLKRLDSLAQTLIDPSNAQFKFAGGESNRWPIDLNSVDLQGVASPFDSGSSTDSLNRQDITIGVSGNPLDQCIGLIQYYLANPTYNSHSKLVLYDKQKQSRFDGFQGVKNVDFFTLQDTRAYRQKQAEDIKKLNLDVFRSQKESLIADKQELNQKISELKATKEKLESAVERIKAANPGVLARDIKQGVVTPADRAARVIGNQASNQSVELLSGELERVRKERDELSKELRSKEENYLNIPKKMIHAIMAILGGLLLLVVVLWGLFKVVIFLLGYFGVADSSGHDKKSSGDARQNEKVIEKAADASSSPEHTDHQQSIVSFSDWLNKPESEKDSLIKDYNGLLLNFNDKVDDEVKVNLCRMNAGLIALFRYEEQNDSVHRQVFYQDYKQTKSHFESNNYFLNLLDSKLSFDTVTFDDADRFKILKKYRERDDNIYEISGINLEVDEKSIIRHFRYVIYHLNEEFFQGNTVKRDLIRSSEKTFVVPIVKKQQ
jgi:hypothetical protein